MSISTASVQFFIISAVLDLLTGLPAFKLFLHSWLSDLSKNTNQIMSLLSLKPLQQLLTAFRIKSKIFCLASRVPYDLQQPVIPTSSATQ